MEFACRKVESSRPLVGSLPPPRTLGLAPSPSRVLEAQLGYKLTVPRGREIENGGPPILQSAAGAANPDPG